MTDDLHTRLTAEIQRRLNITQTAATASPPDWQWDTQYQAVAGQRHSAFAGYIAGECSDHDGIHIALHDPADARRRYTHYRQILKRHNLVPYSDEATFLWCPGCGYSEGDYCAEIRDVATALGLTINEEEQP